MCLTDKITFLQKQITFSEKSRFYRVLSFRKITELYDLAFSQYSRAVDEVLADRLTEEKQIDHLLDGIIDFGDDPRFIELSKKLCRHIFYHYPQLVGEFVYTYRMLFEDKEDGNGNCDD